MGTDASSECRCVPKVDPWVGCRSTEGSLQGRLRGQKKRPASRPWGKRRPSRSGAGRSGAGR